MLPIARRQRKDPAITRYGGIRPSRSTSRMPPPAHQQRVTRSSQRDVRSRFSRCNAVALVTQALRPAPGYRTSPSGHRQTYRHPHQINQLLVAEPTLCAPVFTTWGTIGGKFHIHGTAVHSSRPEQGANAITAASILIQALAQEHERLYTQSPAISVVGNPTLTVTMISGGEATNVVPSECTLTIDRRVVPGENLQYIQAHLQKVAEANCLLPVTVEITHAVDPFYQNPDTPWIRQLSVWSGKEVETAPYGTNARAYNGLADECVIFGPGSIEQAHRDVEWVAISELEKALAIYLRWWGLWQE